MADKTQGYKRIKIAGLLSFIPFILIGGALAGYLAADFILKRFLNSTLVMPVCILLGLASSVVEVVRVVKLALKIEKGE